MFYFDLAVRMIFVFITSYSMANNYFFNDLGISGNDEEKEFRSRPNRGINIGYHLKQYFLCVLFYELFWFYYIFNKGRGKASTKTIFTTLFSVTLSAPQLT